MLIMEKDFITTSHRETEERPLDYITNLILQAEQDTQKKIEITFSYNKQTFIFVSKANIVKGNRKVCISDIQKFNFPSALHKALNHVSQYGAARLISSAQGKNPRFTNKLVGMIFNAKKYQQAFGES